MSLGRVFAAVLAVAIAVGIGVAIYNAGVSAGFAEAARQAAAAGDPIPVPGWWGLGWLGPYGNGPFGPGIGFFGVIFWILGVFLVIGLLRAAFGWGRWRGPGPGSGRRGWGDRSERVEEWHRELHRREADAGPPRTAGA
jgi:hypothetical protein